MDAMTKGEIFVALTTGANKKNYLDHLVHPRTGCGLWITPGDDGDALYTSGCVG